MQKYYLFATLFMLAFFCRLSAQQGTVQIHQLIEDLTEHIPVSEESENDYQILFEDLIRYYQNPLNINEASDQELRNLHFLNDFQISSLQQYKKENGYLLSIYELTYIYGFTIELVRKISPFITVEAIKESGSLKFSSVRKYGRHDIFIRGQGVLQKQRGYIPVADSILDADPYKNRFLGSPVKLYTTYRYRYQDKLYAGLVAEKDAGEEFFRGSNPQGFDYYSGHLQLNDQGMLKRIVVGDYHIQAGQGLAVWSGLSPGKSGYVSGIKKNAALPKKNTSVNEYGFLRGMAATLEMNKLNVTAFFSKKKIDGNIQDTLPGGTLRITSFQQTGLHATPGEIHDEKAVDETVAGGNISWNANNYRLGLSLAKYWYSAYLLPGNALYQQYDFYGRDGLNAGFDYHVHWKKTQFFGETAYGNNAFATVNGAMFYIDPQILAGVLYRNYDRSYYAPYSSAFSEGSENSNEKGIYFGTEIIPFSNVKISAYYDIFSFPWLRYRISAPSAGNEGFFRFDFTPENGIKTHLRCAFQKKMLDAAGEQPLVSPSENKQTGIRFHISYPVSSGIIMQNRVEWKSNEHNNVVSHGWLLYHDIIYHMKIFPLNLAFRYAIFDTDDYSSRIYSYENDLLYAYSVPAYYYKGTRTYLMLKYSFSNRLDMWIKYSHTGFIDRDITGTGLYEIEGSCKSEIKMQLRMHF